MPEIKDSNAIIIGASHGMGLETAKLLVSRGANVIITGRHADSLQSAKEQLGDKATTHQIDISSSEERKNLPKVVTATFGEQKPLDLIYVNAAHARFAPFLEYPEDILRRTIETNFIAPFMIVQSLVPLLKDGGAIVFTTSISNVRGFPGMSAYSASKAAIQSLVETMAAELASRRIRVNTVSPGFIRTPDPNVLDFPKEVLPGLDAYGVSITPMERLGEPIEVAKAVVYLGYDATFTTGSELVVDGGLTAAVKPAKA
ncbi:putative short chain dehydrogenase [Westerdykella ornata]|uniref:Putative short chain dehydrogenase n=1 Tax=Westerdykella ornata TaxID=318751 RepID=A0A6A6JM51_WESOR|nr:putative short chain dehydrogenase [Westerdykella ornata]KAF2277587.1 putative short chain dehydrogenase [Westerdykella ornata]